MTYSIFDRLMPYFQIMRFNNWVKNILIFLPLLSSHNLETQYLINTIFIFFMFSLTASSMYIINDYFDYEKDLLNEAKKKRPIASGKISKINGLILFFLIQIFLLTILVLSDNLKLLAFLMFYNLMVYFYTIKFKFIKFLDVFILGLLFVYRVYIGAEFNSLEASIWIINFTFFFFVGLAFLKRHAELNSTFIEKKNLSKLRPYKKKDKQKISLFSFICITIATILLINYFSTSKIKLLYQNTIYLYAIPPVFFTYCFILFDKLIINKSIEDPINYCLKLKSSWIFFIFILILLILAK